MKKLRKHCIFKELKIMYKADSLQNTGHWKQNWFKKFLIFKSHRFFLNKPNQCTVFENLARTEKQQYLFMGQDYETFFSKLKRWSSHESKGENQSRFTVNSIHSCQKINKPRKHGHFIVKNLYFLKLYHSNF